MVVEGACPEGLEAGDGLGVVVAELAGWAGTVFARGVPRIQGGGGILQLVEASERVEGGLGAEVLGPELGAERGGEVGAHD